MSENANIRSNRCLALVLLALGWFLTGCGDTTPEYYQGYVEGDYVYLASSEAGHLERLLVSKGQTVAGGDMLFQIDPNPQSLQIDQARQRLQRAQAQLADISTGSRPSEVVAMEAKLESARAAADLARREYQRRVALDQEAGSDAVSAEEIGRSKTDVVVREQEVLRLEAELVTARLGGRTGQVMAARSEVQSASVAQQETEWRLNQKTVSAPDDGFVQDTLYREGEFVPAGRAVISLLPPTNIKVRFFIPEKDLSSVQLNAPVVLRIDGLDTGIDARISYISPQAEFTPPVIYSRETRSKLVFMIEAVPDTNQLDRLHPGQPLEVHLN